MKRRKVETAKQRGRPVSRLPSFQLNSKGPPYMLRRNFLFSALSSLAFFLIPSCWPFNRHWPVVSWISCGPTDGNCYLIHVAWSDRRWTAITLRRVPEMSEIRRFSRVVGTRQNPARIADSLGFGADHPRIEELTSDSLLARPCPARA